MYVNSELGAVSARNLKIEDIEAHYTGEGPTFEESTPTNKYYPEIFASEEFKCNAVVENGKLITSFKPYEIKTFAVTLTESDVKGKKAVSSPAKVKFDKNIITHQRNEKSDFEYNIPREITPDTVSVNGIDFVISKTSENAFVLNGQKIELSEDMDKLCLLCATLNDDKYVTFDIDGKKISKKVFNMF